MSGSRRCPASTRPTPRLSWRERALASSATQPSLAASSLTGRYHEPCDSRVGRGGRFFEPFSCVIVAIETTQMATLRAKATWKSQRSSETADGDEMLHNSLKMATSKQWTFIPLFHHSDDPSYPISVPHNQDRVSVVFIIISHHLYKYCMYFICCTLCKKEKRKIVFFLYVPLGSLLFIHSEKCKHHCDICVIERAFLYIFYSTENKS